MSTRKGRRPRPTALKLLQGERPSRVNDDEPPSPPGPPPQPESLAEPVERAWQLIVATVPANVMTHADEIALRCFAQVLAEHDRAAELVNSVGPLVRDEHGLPRTNPAVRIRREAGRDVYRWAIEFGMTPASRSQIRARLAGGGMPALDATAARFLS